MKKKLLFAMAAGAMLFATSCQNDLDVMGNVGDEALVSFSITTPEMVTRAYSDGTTANVLEYAVYNAAGEHLTALDGEKAINISTNVEIQLATGNTYTVLFWAANENAPYGVDFDAKTMTVDYTNAVSNDEARDAFFAKHTFTVTGTQTENVKLYRPFAQINVGTADYKASEDAGYKPTQSQVKVATYETLNLWDGSVADDVTCTFAFADIKKDETFPVNGYEYLAMNYVLVGAKQVVDVEFSYTDEASAAKTRTVGSVPVQRNYRTNIYGNLLTSMVDINVEIVPDYNEPDLEAEALYLAAAFGGEVTLTEDVALTAPLMVQANMILNLGDYTISNPNGYAIENNAELTINATNGGINGLGGIRSKGGKITINGGTFTGSSDWNNGTYQHILKAENTEVEINGGNFDATIGGMTNAMINVAENAVVTINGGTFKNVNGVIPQFAPYMFTYEKNGKLIINDGNFYGGWRFNGVTATTDIYGGDFTVSYDGQSFHAASTHVLTIYGGVFSTENGGKLIPTNFLVDGYVTTKNADGKYTVAMGTMVNDVTSLEAAINNAPAGSTIVLAKNVNYGDITIGEWSDVIIESEENTTMRFITTADSKIENVTLKNATFNYTTGANQKAGSFVVIDAAAEIENLVIENCTLVGDGNKNSYGIYGQNPNASIVVKDCNFSKLGYAIQTIAGGGYKSLVVENSTFEEIKSWAIMPQYGYSGDLEITGCTFANTNGGLVKTGAFNGTFTFTNNTITNSVGHDGKDSKWFDVNASAATKVVSGNTKDGAAWTPGAENGLK